MDRQDWEGVRQAPDGHKNAQRVSWPVTFLQAFLDGQRLRARTEAKPRAPLGVYALATGGCEGCAMEVQTLPLVTAFEGSGFQLVADPRLADWLLVSGPVTRASALRLNAAWEHMPPGRSLIALGECAVNGGLFSENYAVLGGLEALSRTWRAIPGCPPAPQDILAALVALAQPENGRGESA